MHDLIYANQERLDRNILFELAEILDLSTLDLETALKNGTYKGKVKEDFRGGIRSGVNGTPTFFINDHRHTGSWEFEDLVTAIKQASLSTII
jgi:protein-disulfide isomerase